MSALFSRQPKELPPRREIARQRQNQTVESSSGQDQSYTFRRNYTITGSASSSVSTLNEQGSQLKSARVHAHDLTRKRRHLGLLFSASALSCVALLFLISQFTASLSFTINNDSSIAPKSDYVKTIEEYYSHAPLERLRFALNSDALAAFVKLSHPEVESLTLSGDDKIGSSHVSLQTRRPIASWDIGGQSRFVDSHGVNFTTNYYDQPSVKIVDRSGIKVDSGQTVASNSFLGFVGKVVGYFVSSHHLEVAQVIIPSEASRQIDVVIEGVGYPIKLSTDRPAGEQAEDAARALAWLRGHGNPKLDYLDARVSGRVFYR